MRFLNRHPIFLESVAWLTLAWTALFFVVIVPGHNRGAMSADAVGPDGREVMSFRGLGCVACMGLSSGGAKSEGEHPVPMAPTRSCLVCYLAGVLDTPPPAIDVARLLIILEEGPLLDGPDRVVTVTLQADRTRGPPAWTPLVLG